jgi:hypothetical protein
VADTSSSKQRRSPYVKSPGIVPKDIELVVVHAFTEKTQPAVLDRPYYDLEFIGHRLARHSPPATDIRLRQGPVAAAINEITGKVAVTWLS